MHRGSPEPPTDEQHQRLAPVVADAERSVLPSGTVDNTAAGRPVASYLFRGARL